MNRNPEGMTEIYVTSSRFAFKIQRAFYNNNIPSGFFKRFRTLVDFSFVEMFDELYILNSSLISSVLLYNAYPELPLT